MRTIMCLGTITLGLAFGVAPATADNVDPHASPYATIAPMTVGADH
jgi:hypothetical protein